VERLKNGGDWQAVLHSLQALVTTWEGSLSATSGAIVPQKSYWYLDDFQWSGGNWRYKNINECKGDIKVKSIYGELETLKRNEVNWAEETLGIHIVPDGNRCQQVEKIINIAKEWVAKMKEGKLSRTEIWLAVQLTVWRTLIYPLPALNLTKQECEQIMAPILNFVLPALGICRNFPRCIVHA